MTRRTPPNPHATPAPRVDVAALAEYTAGVIRAVAANRDRERAERRRDQYVKSLDPWTSAERRRRST